MMYNIPPIIEAACDIYHILNHSQYPVKFKTLLYYINIKPGTLRWLLFHLQRERLLDSKMGRQGGYLKPKDPVSLQRVVQALRPDLKVNVMTHPEVQHFQEKVITLLKGVYL